MRKRRCNSMSKMDTKDNSCEVCFRITCKRCEWVATDQEVERIQKGNLNACPICGWKPGEIES